MGTSENLHELLILADKDREGVLSDTTKSLSRAYINNFQDKSKQIAIDTLLACGIPVLYASVLTFISREISVTRNLS